MAFNSWTLLLIIVPLTMAVLAVALDIASRRGYRLGALALGTLVLALWGFGAFSQAAQGVASSADSLEVIAYALVYFVGELFLALLLTLSAVVATSTARQWWWLGGIVVVSVVPAVLIFTSSATLLPSLLDALGLPHSASAAVLVLPPVLVTCAYVMARSVRRPLAR
ncbi:MAG TPA: hypothetical protein VE338_05030 [Ktedonobacterales bacterium]|jgi:hypothetical protein|nr:hypothetical protein [Ktedonobacterales bacterium]